MNKIFFITLMTLAAATAANAQIAQGGTYKLDKAVIAGGGGSSGGGTYSVTGAIGQATAGTTASAGTYSVDNGFFTPDPFAPSGAVTTISGRVRTAGGVGIRNVLVTLSLSDGTTRTTYTGSLGSYFFADVEVGQTVIVTVNAKRYSFEQPTRIISLMEDISRIDFTGIE